MSAGSWFDEKCNIVKGHDIVTSITMDAFLQRLNSHRNCQLTLYIPVKVSHEPLGSFCPWEISSSTLEDVDDGHHQFLEIMRWTLQTPQLRETVLVHALYQLARVGYQVLLLLHCQVVGMLKVWSHLHICNMSAQVIMQHQFSSNNLENVTFSIVITLYPSLPPLWYLLLHHYLLWLPFTFLRWEILSFCFATNLLCWQEIAVSWPIWISNLVHASLFSPKTTLSLFIFSCSELTLFMACPKQLRAVDNWEEVDLLLLSISSSSCTNLYG